MFKVAEMAENCYIADTHPYLRSLGEVDLVVLVHLKYLIYDKF